MATVISLLTSRAGLVIIALGLAWMWHVAKIDSAIIEHDLTARAERQEAINESKMQEAKDRQVLTDKLTREKAEIQAKYDDLFSKVPKAVSKSADAKCVVPAGFVWHYDSAWGMPNMAGRPGNADAESGVPLSVVLSTDTANAKTCVELKADLATWKQWSQQNRNRFKAFEKRIESKLP